MFRVVGALGWIALVVAAFSSPSSAKATTTAAVVVPRAAPAPAVPRDLHFRFYLEPSTGGARTLVLRDGADLEIQIGEVQRDWACDSQVRRYGAGTDNRGLQVACGGGALSASLDITEGRHEREPSSVKLRTSRGSRFDIPFDHGAMAWLDPQLVDPAAGTCDDAAAGYVAVSVESAPAEPGDSAREIVHVRATGLPLDEEITAYDGERCSVEANAEGTAMEAKCEYVREPHADIVELRVTEGALLWTTIDRSVCVGGAYIHGGWRLPCGAPVHWPSDAVVSEELWTAHPPGEPDSFEHPYQPIEPTW